MTLLRIRCLCAVMLSSSVVLLASQFAFALPEPQIRRLVNEARLYEKAGKWEQAREIYELLLSQPDHGLRVRDRYHEALRRCWQSRRHQDTSYRKEVLAIDYAQAVRVYNIISNTLLEGSVEKKKIDPTRLFKKGLEEFDAALADQFFVNQHVPLMRHGEVAAFRALLRKTWGESNKLTRKEAARQIGEIAMEAEMRLGINATVVAMEFACGACYAIDEYTAYLTPNQLRELAQSLSRTDVMGVGLKLTIRDNHIIVHEVDPESLAAEVLSKGDLIISVNKKAVVDLPLEDVKNLLEGPVGSMVEIEYASQDMMLRTATLQRRGPLNSIGAPILWPNSNYGYLRISSFTESTVQELDERLIVLARQGMKGLILDLRANDGGIFEASIDSARRFIANGIVTSTQHQDPKFNVVYHSKNPNALTLPMVVLIDGDTASAAEVLAGALKDNNRALLIGQTTYGKGCTQCVLKLPNASGNIPTGGMKLTVARFFSPKGVAYSARGVIPHIFIDEQLAASESTMVGRDAYMHKAIEELDRVLAMPK